MWMPIQLDLEGEHTGLLSPLCMECPHGATGCCASPPGFDWSDVGRVLKLGGRAWLIDQMAAGLILPLQHKYGSPSRGLQLLRIENPAANAGVWPTKCNFHGDQGCTIGRDRRPATCNYYLCDQAFEMAGEAGEPAREAQALLQTLYGRWDLEIAGAVAERWPQHIPWDNQSDAILALVEIQYDRSVRRDRRELKRLSSQA